MSYLATVVTLPSEFVVRGRLSLFLGARGGLLDKLIRPKLLKSCLSVTLTLVLSYIGIKSIN